MDSVSPFLSAPTQYHLCSVAFSLSQINKTLKKKDLIIEDKLVFPVVEKNRGAWVAQCVKCPILGFGSSVISQFVSLSALLGSALAAQSLLGIFPLLLSCRTHLIKYF